MNVHVTTAPSPPGGDDMQRNSQDLRGLQDRARGQADALQKLVGASTCTPPIDLRDTFPLS